MLRMSAKQKDRLAAGRSDPRLLQCTPHVRNGSIATAVVRAECLRLPIADSRKGRLRKANHGGVTAPT